MQTSYRLYKLKPMFIAALFIGAKPWKWLICVSTDEWIKET